MYRKYVQLAWGELDLRSCSEFKLMVMERTRNRSAPQVLYLIFGIHVRSGSSASLVPHVISPLPPPAHLTSCFYPGTPSQCSLCVYIQKKEEKKINKCLIVYKYKWTTLFSIVAQCVCIYSWSLTTQAFMCPVRVSVYSFHVQNAVRMCVT